MLFIVFARSGHCFVEMKQLGSSHSRNTLFLICSLPMTTSQLTRLISRTKATLWWSLYLTPNFYQPPWNITMVWCFSNNEVLFLLSFFDVNKEQQLSFYNSNWWATIDKFFPAVCVNQACSTLLIQWLLRANHIPSPCVIACHVTSIFFLRNLNSIWSTFLKLGLLNTLQLVDIPRYLHSYRVPWA